MGWNISRKIGGVAKPPSVLPSVWAKCMWAVRWKDMDRNDHEPRTYQQRTHYNRLAKSGSRYWVEMFCQREGAVIGLAWGQVWTASAYKPGPCMRIGAIGHSTVSPFSISVILAASICYLTQWVAAGGDRPGYFRPGPIEKLYRLLKKKI